MKMQMIPRFAAALALLIAVASCSDINKQRSPVSLVLTNTQNLTQIDLAPDATGCNRNLGTVQVTAIQVQPANTTNPNLTLADLNQVKLDRYRVSYQRLDGGHLVPAPFVKSTSGLLRANGNPVALSDFVVFETAALNLAPFAALQPQNGGRDPETGLTTVTMDVTLEVFGQTLAGETVSGSTRFTVTFCFACGGCA